MSVACAAPTPKAEPAGEGKAALAIVLAAVENTNGEAVVAADAEASNEKACEN